MGRRKKKPFSDVEITGIAHKGKAVGRAPTGEVLFIEGGVPGDRAEVLGLRKKKGVWQGIVKEITRPSPQRQAPFCKHFDDCGGCKWQHFSYEGQLEHKQKSVVDAMRRIGKLPDAEIRPILAAPQTTAYRNKMEYSFSAKRWITEKEIEQGGDIDGRFALGLHRPGAFDKIVDLDRCWLQAEPGNAIRNAVKTFAIQQGWSFYDPREQTGWLRALVLRNNEEGQWMLMLVAAERREEKINQLFAHLQAEFDVITSYYFMCNPKKNDALQDLEAEHWSGEEYLRLQLGAVSYDLGPKSFFQTNTQQARNLYDQVIEFADLQGHETVYDLYCGIGSIGLYLAGRAGRVVGIDIIEEAIEDARKNAARHPDRPMQFFAGDVKELLQPDFTRQYGAPDIVITDPPRAGMHEDVIAYLLKERPARIVYVSCNPATQARDCARLSELYDIPFVQPVDMFPHTSHVESIAQLNRKI